MANGHTNEQAKELWCPMARVAQAGEKDIPIAYNRVLNRQLKQVMLQAPTPAEEFELGKDDSTTIVAHVLEATPSISMAANCAGSRCAMWRWNDAAQEAGFCGLAGTPLYFATQAAKQGGK